MWEEKSIKQFNPRGKLCWECREKARIAANVNWRANNRDYLLAYREAHREEYPEKYVHKSSRRRAAKLLAVGSYAPDDIKLHMKLQEGCCAYCGCNLEWGYHVDHIFPISRYFYNGPENMQLLCGPCNLKKNDKDPYEYERSRGYLTDEREIKLNEIKAIIEAAHVASGVENYDSWRAEIKKAIIQQYSFEDEDEFADRCPPEFYEPRYTYEMWGHT